MLLRGKVKKGLSLLTSQVAHNIRVAVFYSFSMKRLRVHSFGVIWNRISDPRSVCIKGTDENISRVDSLIPLMNHDPDRSWITDPDSDHPKGTHP